MERITRWLDGKSTRREQEVTLVDALLCGKFAAYARRRLAGFALGRVIGAFTHILESTLLVEVFADRGIIASLALKNTSLLVGAFFWGSLEVMRSQLRSDLSRNAMSARVGRWLGGAVLLGGLAVVLPLAVSMGACIRSHRPFLVLDAYALVCGVRLGVDVVVRTYYSGVYAIQRVPRPLVSTLLGEPLGLAAVLVLWPILGGWCFPVGLLSSVIVSRALAVHYATRTYRLLRLPVPRVRWPVGRNSSQWTTALSVLVRAGAGYLSTRLGSMLVLAAMLGPLLADDPPSEAVYALNFVATFLGAAGYFTQCFYPDFKRLEDEAYALMRRRLLRGLLRTALVVAVALWLASAAVIRWVAGSFRPLPIVLFLFPVFVTTAMLSALQLRDFARGRFLLLLAASVPMCGALLGIVITGGGASLPLWALLMTGAVMSAIVVQWVAGRIRPRPSVSGVQPDVLRWARALCTVHSPVRVACATTRGASVAQCRLIASRIAEHLGDRGASVVAMPSRRLLLFEQAPVHVERAHLSNWGAGKIESIAYTEMQESGRAAIQAAVKEGLFDDVTATSADASAAALASEFAKVFADRGIVTDLKSRVGTLAALPCSVARAIWRDATSEVRSGTPKRQQSGFEVASFRPGGRMRLLFAIPRTEPIEARRSWRRTLERANWAAATCVED